MRKLLAYLLTALIIIASFKEATIFVFFKLNQEYIAENLCVEKDIEESTCQGCCQLKKKIDETKEQEQKTTNEEQQRTFVQIIYCIDNNKNQFSEAEAYIKSVSQIKRTETYSFIFSKDCFHPPKA